MKSKEEIEQLAKQYAESFRFKISSSSWHEEKCDDFTQGYTQSQEDMKPLLKTLFALWETLAESGEISVGIDFTKHYEKLKQQLNK